MKTPIYFDNNATTPVDPRVLDAMLPYFCDRFGNAASKTHAFGWQAEEAVGEARRRIAELIGGRPSEIVFTSGATEANNLAILGFARSRADRGRHIVSSMIEHKAVLDPLTQLEREGFEVTRLRPNHFGEVEADSVAAALRDDTILVSLMLANNEIGSLNPIAEVADYLRGRHIVLHTDAAQGIGKLDVDVEKLGVDLMSMSGHKVYGPKGVGALFVRQRARTGEPRIDVRPIQYGGGHERGLRSGTLPVPLIVGFGRACEIYRASGVEERRGLAELTRMLYDRLSQEIGGVELNGPPIDMPRLPGLLNVSFRGIESEALMLGMPELAVSSGSACTSHEIEPSHVLRGIGASAARAHGSIRFGLGRFNRRDEIAYGVRIVARQNARLRG